jgi:NADH dehydrogenase
MTDIHLVTGAFGFSGSHIARELLSAGKPVRTLTSSAPRGPSAAGIEVFPLDPGRPERMGPAFEGVDTFFNTYWVRFQAAGFDQLRAVEHSAGLFRLAAEAGVRRIVHVSVSNPSQGSPYAYFRGKAAVEAALVASGVPHSILRPAVLFGRGDVLFNNIAWLLRHMPVFAIPGDGAYGVRPIHVRDLARLALEEAACAGNRTLDAVGPESFTYRELVERIERAVGVRRRIVCVSPSLVVALSRALGLMLRDVLLTREEMGALMDGLLDTPGPATAPGRLSDWLAEHGDTFGRRYASELRRRRPEIVSESPARARSPAACGGQC